MTTNIEWVHNPDGSKGKTWPVVTGCSPVSTGCRNCYAARMAATRLKHHPRYKGLATMQAPGMPRWTGEVRLNHDVLEQPLRWKKPRKVFVASMGDLFHEDVPFRFVDYVFHTIELARQHRFQVLTKQPRQMLKYMISRSADFPLPNVWLGVSVENQATADERREFLRQSPAAVKFVSYEPALGPVDWTGWEFVDQIISGGESGPGARPSHPDWHRATRDFCQENGIAYFFKGWGAWAHIPSDTRFPLPQNLHWWPDRNLMGRVGKKRARRVLDGALHEEYPQVA